MSELKIPPKNRKEWEMMVTGEIDHQYKNYVLQMKIANARKNILENKETIESAIDSIYLLCKKYSYAVHSDFVQIFKEW